MVNAGSWRKAVALAMLGLFLGTNGVEADPVRVAVAGDSPFVITTDGIYSGLAVEIWQQIALLNSWESQIISYPDALTAGKAVAAGEADILVSDVPITSGNLKLMDFSQPYFRAGLQIMISDARPHTMARLMEDLGSWFHLKVFWALAGAVVLMTVGVTLFERKHNPEFPTTWHAGLAEAFYYVISLTLTSPSVYKGFPGVLGRLMLVFWTALGVITVAYLTSSITTAMTVERLQSHISGPQDLPGKKVGTAKGSKAIDYLGRHNINTNVYPTLDEAVKALQRDEVRAVVASAPILQYFDNNHPTLPITEVGPVFFPYNYGFALQPGSPLRHPLNATLLRLQESGALLDLGRKYFGAVHQP